MLENYKLILQKTFPFRKQEIALATSGGLDSMVMAQLFRQLSLT
jgi:tRNA(Ile)-lysidine synthase TilS/MesJ